MSKHTLVINSLRDLDAVCSCGRWHLTTTIFDRHADKEIRRHARRAHAEHVRIFRWLEKSQRP